MSEDMDADILTLVVRVKNGDDWPSRPFGYGPYREHRVLAEYPSEHSADLEVTWVRLGSEAARDSVFATTIYNQDHPRHSEWKSAYDAIMAVAGLMHKYRCNLRIKAGIEPYSDRPIFVRHAQQHLLDAYAQAEAIPPAFIRDINLWNTTK